MQRRERRAPHRRCDRAIMSRHCLGAPCDHDAQRVACRNLRPFVRVACRRASCFAIRLNEGDVIGVGRASSAGCSQTCYRSLWSIGVTDLVLRDRHVGVVVQREIPSRRHAVALCACAVSLEGGVPNSGPPEHVRMAAFTNGETGTHLRS